MLREQTSSTKCSPTWAKTSIGEAKEPIGNMRRQCVGSDEEDYDSDSVPLAFYLNWVAKHKTRPDRQGTEVNEMATSPPHYTTLNRPTVCVEQATAETEASAPRLLDTEPFEKVFGKKATKKKPTLDTYDIIELVKKANEDLAKWEESQGLLIPGENWIKDEQLEIIFKAGTSKRIWNELYKVCR
ncbi:nucleolar GTP-binding protein 2 [Plakobranchus ocellatus]|uniref:Nucleolar GTP-binding protein 2 n=1 Tax=Plakobranchus ocellatus TaxID=259542 RepID=A0AAV4B7Z2_9GAST|nr:nucleolar GTP-binding protein 2 [Plakobranchus ocellatus]